jgi:hypothetical protein
MASYQEERRAEERFPTVPQADCSFASPVLEDFGKVKVMNISCSGIGLIATDALAPGMLLAIKLVNPAKQFSKIMFVRVVQATPLKGGSFLIGGVLDPPLTYEELCALIM